MSHHNNISGQAYSLTVLTPIIDGHETHLAEYLNALPSGDASPLAGVFGTHFARWTLIRRLPADPGLAAEPLRADLLLFESNFNFDWESYIDAFSYVIPDRMKLIWQGSYGFPGPVPSTPFKEYIRANEYEAAHYYSAYPDASVTMILAALELGPKIDELVAASRTFDAPRFAERFEELLTEVQP